MADTNQSGTGGPVEPSEPGSTPPVEPGGPAAQPAGPAMGSYASGPPTTPPYSGPAYQGQPYPGQQYPVPPATYPAAPYPSPDQPTQPIPTQGFGQQLSAPYPGEPVAYPGPPSGPVPPQAAGPYTPQPAGPYAPQPPAGQYPNQPYTAPQPYPGQAYPGTQQYPGPPAPPFSPQPPYGGQPTPGRNKGLLYVLLGVGVLVIALVLLMAFFRPDNLLVTQPTTGASTAAGPGPTSVPPAQPADASAAVQGYLAALAQGDAATALSFAATQPADTSLLTDEVLAAGQQRAPITDVRVAPATGAGSTETIDASYKLGARVVDASFQVSRAGSAWLLDEVAAHVSLYSLYPDSLALRLNGVALSSNDVVLFPGTYVVSADDGRYAISKGGFLVESPLDRPDTAPMKVVLSSSGRAGVRAAAQKKLSACVRAHNLKPSGCGFGTYLPGNNKARVSTIHWRITKGGNAMRKIKPTVDVGDPTVVRASVNVQLKVTLRSTNGRSWIGYSAIYQMLGDVSGSGVKVTFP